MKTLACVCILVAAICDSTAYAGTETRLASPLVFNYYTNAHCTFNPPALTSATGFSADGATLNGVSSGQVGCGHSGRDGGVFYTYYCMADVWDLSGNLISVTVQPLATCAAEMQSQPQFRTFTDPLNSGYEAYTVTNVYYGYIQSRYAMLVTP